MAAWNFDTLRSHADRWKRQASDLDFLGELALSQADLEPVLKAVGVFHQRVAEPELSFALAVAAVNWAYWRGVGDDESSGFRDSFMTHSLGHCDLRAWECVWGPAIERAICAWCNQVPRTGAYRYVGLILRHAGVPHAKIPKLAQLLQEIDDHIGWENVPASRDADLQGYVGACFGSGCVREHLMSEAGLAYVRSLCADLLFVRSQPSRPPADLPGYRPGLLAELLTRLRPGAPRPASPAFPLPYVVLQAESGRIELVFDERLVRRRDQIQCDQYHRRLFDARMDLGPGGIEPAPFFTGRLPDGRSWSTKGWRYSDPGAWALFRADGRLATTHSHEDSVSAGDYLLLVVPAQDLDVPSRWPDAGDAGERFLPDGTECRLWHVALRSGDDGKLPGLRVAASGPPWLECANAGPLTRWTPYDAVCADAPRLRVGGWTARASRRFRLTMSTAGGGTRDLVPHPSADGSAWVVLCDLPAGHVAEVNLIPIGYQHGPRATQVLRVVRFPGSVEMEHGLWPLTESVVLRVTISGGVELAAEPGAEAQVVRERGSTCVSVPPHVHWAAVRAVAAGAFLQLRLPVGRCSFCPADAPGTPALFDRASLRQMCDGASPCQAFTVSAAPGAAIDLLARDRRGASRVWRRGLRLGSNGRLELKAAELVDVARSERGILELLVRCEHMDVPTGALFVDPVDDDDVDSGPWPQAVMLYLQLLRQPLVAPDQLDELAQAPCLHRHALLIAQVDHALGLSPVSPNPKVISAAREWIAHLQRLLADSPKGPGAGALEWKAALPAWLHAAPLPYCPRRWKPAIDARISEVDRRVDIAGPLARMLAGEREPLVPSGLSHGWTCYVSAVGGPPHEENLLLQANHYFSTAARGAPPWRDIAERLSAWTLLRAGAFAEFCGAVRRMGDSEQCPGLTKNLRAVASLVAMAPVGDSPPEPGGLELSCRDDDRLLAAAVAGGTDAWPRAAERCWLAAWLGWRRSIIMGLHAEHGEAYRRLCAKHLDRLPGRAFEIISQELRSGVPRPINGETEF